MAEYKTTITKTKDGGSTITSGNMTKQEAARLAAERERTKNMNTSDSASAASDALAKDIAAKKRYTEMQNILASGKHKSMSDEEKAAFVKEYKKLKLDYSFNEGGVVPMNNMAKQMEMFDDGGLMDEGGTVDPVSGNDVPPGSTQEEVRDDIPAQLSEGEFVFPADVVRYFGLEKLMEMRQEAKMGLQRMEDMGQMGNSEEATMPDNLPFDIDDLEMEEEQSDLNFNLGGVVPMQGTGVVNTANAGPTTGFTPYVAPAIPGFTGPQLQNTQYTTATQTTNLPTFLQTVGNKPGEYDEFRRYVNNAGQVRQIPFKNGQPLYPIPEGFRFEAMGTTTPTDTSTTPVTVTGQQQDDGGGDGGTVGVGSSTVTGASDMETAMMDSSRGMFGTRDSSVGTFGSNREFGFSNDAMRSATVDMAMAQFGSLSPMAAAGIAIGNKLGILDNMSTPNQNAIAGQTAKGMALSAMGFSNPGQISTNEQATAYGLAISAAMEASKKGQDVGDAVDAVMAQNQEAVKQGQISALTDIGYSASDISNIDTVSRAMAGYNALADAYDQDAREIASTGFVMDKDRNPVRTRDITTGKLKGNVMKQSALDQLNAFQSKAAQARAKATSLSSLDLALDRARKSGVVDAAEFGPGTGGYSTEDAAAAADVAGHSGDTGPGGSGADHGADAAGSTGAGTGTDCLTEDMKVNLNGVIDFVTNIKVGDIIDNYKVKEVIHKHMRSGYYAINNELKISNDHPVLANGTWTRPENLVVGDSINGIPVASLEYIERMTPTVSIVIDGESFDVHTENNIYIVHGRYKEVRQEAA